MKFLKSFFTTLAEVFSHVRAWIFYILLILVVFLSILIVQNGSFLLFLIKNTTFSFIQKLLLFFTIFKAFFTLNDWYIILLTGVFIILIALYILFFIYYFKKIIQSKRQTFGPIFAGIIGIIGVGCTACGSILLTTLIGISASSVVITFLPFKGLEFLIFGIVLLSIMLLYISHKIQSPLVCHISLSQKNNEK